MIVDIASEYIRYVSFNSNINQRNRLYDRVISTHDPGLLGEIGELEVEVKVGPPVMSEL